LLESGAANVERKIKSDARRLNDADDPCDQSFVFGIGPDEMCFRKAVLKTADEFVRIVTQ
jgi:hypothetical protein